MEQKGETIHQKERQRFASGLKLPWSSGKSHPFIASVQNCKTTFLVKKKKRNLPSGKFIHARVSPVCTTQDSFSFTAFAPAFAAHHLGSLFFLTASSVAVALGLLSYLFKYISFCS